MTISNPDLALATTAQAAGGGLMPDLGDDVLQHAGSATWTDWQNHVPLIVAQCWPQLSAQARLVAFLTAKASTTYRADPRRLNPEP